MVAKIFQKICIALLDWQECVRVQMIKAQFSCCGDRVDILPGVQIWSPRHLRVGSNVAIHSFCHIMASGGLTIGDWVQIASHVSITTITHDPEKIDWDRTVGVESPVVIQKGVWIGTGAVILPGVTLGEYSVVAAGAVVTKDVPPRTIVAGVPARIIRELRVSVMSDGVPA